MQYSKKLKHPKWQKKRLEVFERDEFRCQLCWNNETELHVHHKYYKKGKEPWQYHLKAYLTLCKKCHEKIHPKKKNYCQDDEDEIKEMTPEEKEKKANYAKESLKKIRAQILSNINS